MNRTVVINIAGLSKSVIGAYTPFLEKYISENNLALIHPVLPAVTTTMQSCYVTGKYPNKHGIVGNGWYDKEDCEIKFWKQSNKLVGEEKIWESAKRKNAAFTCSKMFWWYNMYSSADYSVTPRPQYHADGIKLPDCYSHPPHLRDDLQKELGTFPLFNFWGPGADIRSSQWIARASMSIEKKHSPTLTLIYLPHLDYCLQKFGLDFTKVGKELAAIDTLCKELVTFYTERGTKVILLSEYGICNVDHPIHINRILRKEGLISVRNEQGRELLDPGASKAFAVADHQVAHIYLNDLSLKEKVKALLKNVKGIKYVLDTEEKDVHHLAHKRSGDLIVVANAKSWFNYYYWKNEESAPDFAKTVDIHRKPGYDPLEMFLDQKPFTKIKAGYKLLRKKLGFRYLMNVISLDPTLIRGSHGATDIPKEYFPLLISSSAFDKTEIQAPEVFDIILKHVFDKDLLH
ncbi:MAG TPA: nucleotide pyrophosphatase/phosphodiesterase family protein [Bacteroidia bacterium]|jgi:predicted AlkP superfamily pyrophosphatase or phosphodiesterase